MKPFFSIFVVPFLLLIIDIPQLYAMALVNNARVAHIKVYKDPHYGCRSKWVQHIEQLRFSISSLETDDLNQVKPSHSIAARFQSCHTAVTSDGNHVFESYMPAPLIERFLRENPTDTIGFAVQGMATGSPAIAEHFMPYQALPLKKNRKAKVYSQVHDGNFQYKENK